MPLETENVAGNPEEPQENTETMKHSAGTTENGEQLVRVSSENDSQPSVQENACILKQNVDTESEEACSLRPSVPKSPVAEATQNFLLNEKGAYSQEAEPVEVVAATLEPRTPANSEASENGAPCSSEEQLEPTAPQVVEISVYSETIVVEAPLEEPATLNGHSSEEPEIIEAEHKPELTNGQSNGECKYEPRKIAEPEPEIESVNNENKSQVLNGTIANELATEDYKLPDVVEVKKNFEHVERAGQNIAQAPPKKGALSTILDSQSVKQAYQDVRNDGSETQWAVFKFQGAKIVTSATGSDFAQFAKEFGDDDRAFGYIRVQTGDEMSRRAKFLLITWVGPSVSVLKRAKMSTDKALIKDVVSNFAVELQTENISDINLQKFETELDKASGAHYGTGIRS